MYNRSGMVFAVDGIPQIVLIILWINVGGISQQCVSNENIIPCTNNMQPNGPTKLINPVLLLDPDSNAGFSRLFQALCQNPHFPAKTALHVLS